MGNFRVLSLVKARISKLSLDCVIAFIVLVAASQAANAQTHIPNDSAERCFVTNEELRQWFTRSQVTANGPVTVPDSANFPNSPSNEQSIPDCTFYKWAEHIFLWVTSQGQVGAGPYTFESSAFFQVPPDDQNVDHRLIVQNDAGPIGDRLNPSISQRGPRNELVVFDGEGQMYEIVELKGGGSPVIFRSGLLPIPIGHVEEDPRTHMPIFYNMAGELIEGPVVLHDSDDNVVVVKSPPGNTIHSNGRSFFLDQPTKPQQKSRAIAVEPGQANSSVLMAQGNKLVYYMSHVNDIYAYFHSGATNHKILLSRFPTNMDELKLIKEYAMNHNVHSFPDAKALVVELKSSWIELPRTAENSNQYVWMDATIPIYEKHSTPAPPHLETHQSHTVPLAMVGMHVAFAVKGHPELIWATFEHIENTPNAPYQYDTSTGGLAWSQQTCGTWLFSSGPAEPDERHPLGEPPPRTCNGKEIKACGTGQTINAQWMCVSANNRHMYFKHGKIYADNDKDFDASDILRLRPWGSTDISTVFNAAIISLNKSVLDRLAPGDVRKNYVMIGAIWLDDPIIGSGGTQCVNDTRGTRCVANSTMETFDQPSNCLMCHSGRDAKHPDAPKDMLAISHVYKRLVPLFQDPPHP
jgi:hypothetical protein